MHKMTKEQARAEMGEWSFNQMLNKGYTWIENPVEGYVEVYSIESDGRFSVISR